MSLEDDVLLRAKMLVMILSGHLNPLLLHDVVLVGQTLCDISHFANHDLFTIADKLTCRFFESWIWYHFILQLCIAAFD